MSSDESTANSIKRRLRSAGETYAEHTLETAKNAVKGLENTHAAYIYPLQVSSVSAPRSLDIGNLLLCHSSSANSTVFLVDRNGFGHVCGDRYCNLFLWIFTTGMPL